jgi:hypothetical protein
VVIKIFLSLSLYFYAQHEASLRFSIERMQLPRVVVVVVLPRSLIMCFRCKKKAEMKSLNGA